MFRQDTFFPGLAARCNVVKVGSVALNCAHALINTLCSCFFLQAPIDPVHPDAVAQQTTQLTEIQAQLQHALAGLQASWVAMQGAPAPAPPCMRSADQFYGQGSAQASEQQMMLADLQTIWVAMQAAQEAPAPGPAQVPAQQQMLSDLQASWAAMQAAQAPAQGPTPQHMHSPTVPAGQAGSLSACSQKLLLLGDQQGQLKREQLMLQVLQFAAKEGDVRGF